MTTTMDDKATDIFRLQQHWQAVLTTYFPRWRAGREWRCVEHSGREVDGHCDTERRVIEIVRLSRDDDELDKLLIHEVSHAVAEEGHGKKWQERLAQAAVKARAVGRDRLAELLEEEVEGYQRLTQPQEIENAYNRVVDGLGMNPYLPLEFFEQEIAKEYGLLLREVHAMFPDLRAVHEEKSQPPPPNLIEPTTGFCPYCKLEVAFDAETREVLPQDIYARRCPHLAYARGEFSYIVMNGSHQNEWSDELLQTMHPAFDELTDDAQEQALQRADDLTEGSPVNGLCDEGTIGGVPYAHVWMYYEAVPHEEGDSGDEEEDIEGEEGESGSEEEDGWVHAHALFSLEPTELLQALAAGAAEDE